MIPLFEIPGNSIDRSTWRDGWQGVSATGVEVYAVPGWTGIPDGPDTATRAVLRASRYQVEAGDRESPHYYGPEPCVSKFLLPGEAADAETVCEQEFAARCVAWKELSFEADLILVPGDPPRTPREGDCVQVFGFVGTLLEWVPQLSTTARQRAEYRVRLEWE